ncbi:hypothetical protein [Leisingera sp. NJS204]|uniref:hypothetical protein n=1 Tax=Leisingera sp. NJS204 TaxID=2508307 RepID=UPI001012B531|nr:hypothetical protein [Leisingera sp. NJS204]QAX31307.1 hypothetical protein ETW24_19050 [Leisingera sp. NJS204]
MTEAARPSGAAQRLLNDPLLNEILDEMERDAFETGVNAAPPNDEQRRNSMMEVRAIRSLRQQLKTRAAGKTKQPNRVSVA